jgi:sulfite exporter TauE/SafE
VGAIGSVISFSGWARGVVAVLSGVFMVVMGISMLGIFPWINKIIPRMPRFLQAKAGAARKGRGPFIVCLLNGLMPCGPLQAMQIYALGTGSFYAGALAMFLFSLGTVPLMFGLGAVSSLLSRKFTSRAMAVGAVLVVALGLTMLTGGMNLAGVNLAPGSATTTAAIAEAVTESQGVQVVRTTLEPGKFQPITVTAGKPVEWTIDAPEGSINGCNNRMVIPAYGIEHAFTVGENVIRFTPDKAGVYPYSCWMGMITSSITVLDPGSAAGGNEAVTTTAGKSSPDAAAQAPVPASRGSCCAPGAAAGQAPDTTGATSQGFCYAPGADAGQAPDSADSTALGSCCGQ